MQYFKLNSFSSCRDFTDFRAEVPGRMEHALKTRVSQRNGFWLDSRPHTVRTKKENLRGPYHVVSGYLAKQSGPGAGDSVSNFILFIFLIKNTIFLYAPVGCRWAYLSMWTLGAMNPPLWSLMDHFSFITLLQAHSSRCLILQCLAKWSGRLQAIITHSLLAIALSQKSPICSVLNQI